MFKFVMLVKLAFAMQRLRKHLKIFVMINKDGERQFFDFIGGHSCYQGGIELMETVIHCHLALD